MSWTIEVRHDGLNRYRLIRGQTQRIAEQKADAQLAIWNEMWAKKCEARDRAEFREVSFQVAQQLTEEAEEARAALTSILSDAAVSDHRLDWSRIKRSTHFAELPPAKPVMETVEVEPNEKFAPYVYQPNLLMRIFPALGKKSHIAAKRAYNEAKDKWDKHKAQVDSNNAALMAEYQHMVNDWKSRSVDFVQQNTEYNNSIEALKEAYSSGEVECISEYIEYVLAGLDFPESVPGKWQVSYSGETKTAVVEFTLPNIDDLPDLKEARFVASRGMISKTYLKEAAKNTLYDEVAYQLSLAILHAVFSSDVANAVDATVFNGWVDYIDRGTGIPTRACIMSVHTTKAKFQELNLAAVEPKACFKALKGVASTKLCSMAAVAPILQLNKADSRFIASVDVTARMEAGINVATIGWQDFEYLIREIFEKELSSSGGEVRVTQASRDGGVDAIAFDPDPIRGGKIVIQAKRYTNTVGVASVRDLFGTVHNEGATKGILVTTSTYGPDAYQFAQDKPLSLINGAELLHLLSKHGHAARIDLAEAKRVNNENAPNSGGRSSGG